MYQAPGSAFPKSALRLPTSGRTCLTIWNLELHPEMPQIAPDASSDASDDA
jgi:hypothetical protein